MLGEDEQEALMPVLTLKVLAGLLQLHGPGATVQSDHPGIDAILRGVRDQVTSDRDGMPKATEVNFRKAGFIKGTPAYGVGPAFRRAAFRRY
jgi:hypothetical protein